MQGNFFMGQGIAQTFGGGYIYPAGGVASHASPYGQFGQGFPGGAYLQAPVAQQVPIVEGAVMYTQQVRYPKRAGNPNWPFMGPRGGQMWLQ